MCAVLQRGGGGGEENEEKKYRESFPVVFVLTAVTAWQQTAHASDFTKK